MTSKAAEPGRFSLRRWSQRKLEAARAEAQTPPPPLMPAVDIAAAARTPAGTATRALESPGSAPPAELPPIESLTIDSDFAPFFRPQVDESIKRAALKQLFRDPRFNIMDGLDTYIDDYTKADPIPASMLEELMQRRVFFPLPAEDANPAARAIDELAAEPVAISAAPIAPSSAVAPSAPPVAPATTPPAADPVAQVSAIAPERPGVPTAQSGVETSASAKADQR